MPKVLVYEDFPLFSHFCLVMEVKCYEKGPSSVEFELVLVVFKFVFYYLSKSKSKWILGFKIVEFISKSKLVWI